jgi:hypothetical protein
MFFLDKIMTLGIPHAIKESSFSLELSVGYTIIGIINLGFATYFPKIAAVTKQIFQCRQV